MIIKILINIIALIFSILMINKLYREYKKSETINEKVIFIIIVMIFLIPAIIYYADKYNVMSNLGLFENSDSERWFNFVETYISSLISAIIGAVALVLMTIKQLDLERDKNLFDKRIENAPIFKYEIDNRVVWPSHEFRIYNKVNGKPYGLTLTIENIGLNHAKNIEFEIYDGINKKGQKCSFDTQSFLKKDEKKYIRLCFNYKYDTKSQKNNNKEIRIIVRYQDLLNNKYIQNIIVNAEITNNTKIECSGYELYIVSKSIDTEIYYKDLDELKK